MVVCGIVALWRHIWCSKVRETYINQLRLELTPIVVEMTCLAYSGLNNLIGSVAECLVRVREFAGSSLSGDTFVCLV